VNNASPVDTTGRMPSHPSVDSTLLPAVMDHIFVENRDFYTPPALDAAVNFNVLQ